MHDKELVGLLTLEQLESLICCAIEGGSNYWYMITDHNAKEIQEKSEVKVYLSELPLKEGGYLMIGDCEDDEVESKRLDLDVIKKGVPVFAEKYPRHYIDAISSNEDADTGDVFLQCCLFGELVYG